MERMARKKERQERRWQYAIEKADRIVREYLVKRVVLSDAYMWGLSGMLERDDYIYEPVLEEYIRRLLSSGRIYKYGDLGSLKDTVHNRGYITIEEYNNGLVLSIRNAVCRYIASPYVLDVKGRWLIDQPIQYLHEEYANNYNTCGSFL